jgi:hypothetical protein
VLGDYVVAKPDVQLGLATDATTVNA